MAVSYKKLWKLLIDHDMKKKDLAKAADISNYRISYQTQDSTGMEFNSQLASHLLWGKAASHDYKSA